MAEDSAEKVKSIEEQRRDSVADVPGIDPQNARDRLDKLGYKPVVWDTIMKDDIGSHYVRALVYIAKGEEPRRLDDVYSELYPEHTPPGKWQTIKTHEAKEKLASPTKPK